MIAIDSTIVTSPSWIAGMKPPGLTARNCGSFSTPANRVHRPQPIREPHLLQQPDDPKTATFAEDGDHRAQSFISVLTAP